MSGPPYIVSVTGVTHLDHITYKMSSSVNTEFLIITVPRLFWTCYRRVVT